MSEVLKDELKTEEVVPEEAVTEEVVADEAAPEESVAQNVATEEVVADEATPEESVAQNVAIEEVVADEVVAEEVVAEKVASEEVAVEEVTAEEVAPEEVVIEEATAGETAKAVEVVKEKEETPPVEEVADETMSDYEEHFDDANPWNLVTRYMKEKANLAVTIEGVVNGGAITSVEGLRGFIPASRLSLSYVEDLEVFLNKEMEVRVIDVNQSENRLVLSAREILREQENAEKQKQIQSIEIGSISEGVVETLQNYGAFVKLDSGLSGLVHVSQISHKRIKTPGEVLKAGAKVKVKIIGIKDGKISLSIKALDERGPVDRGERDYSPKVDIPKSENIGTSLGDLFKGIKLD